MKPQINVKNVHKIVCIVKIQVFVGSAILNNNIQLMKARNLALNAQAICLKNQEYAIPAQ